MASKQMRFVRNSPVENRPPDPPVDSREAEIARVAYVLAQARGFGPGRELEDWLAAEREVDARLADAAYRQ
jgi:hypothetical protein